MKKLFLFLFCCVTLFAAINPLPFTEEDEQDFYEQLQDELQDSQKRLHDMVMEKAKNRSVFTHGRQVMLDSARNAMETKHTLYSNFYGTPSIQSPEVRKRLLDIFQSDEVTTDDLQDLQTVVYNWQRRKKETQ